MWDVVQEKVLVASKGLRFARHDHEAYFILRIRSELVVEDDMNGISLRGQSSRCTIKSRVRNMDSIEC